MNKIYKPELSNISPKAVIGQDCTIHSHVWIGDGVRIGDRVKIQAFAFLPPGVILEDDVFVGPHVCFTNDPEIANAKRFIPTPTLVKQGARVGANATIRAGVTIGRNAMVGMGSVVLHDVKDGERVVGNPARKL